MSDYCIPLLLHQFVSIHHWVTLHTIAYIAFHINRGNSILMLQVAQITKLVMASRRKPEASKQVTPDTRSSDGSGNGETLTSTGHVR